MSMVYFAAGIRDGRRAVFVVDCCTWHKRVATRRATRTWSPSGWPSRHARGFQTAVVFFFLEEEVMLTSPGGGR